MRSLAPPPRLLHCFRRQPKTPYKRLFDAARRTKHSSSALGSCMRSGHAVRLPALSRSSDKMSDQKSSFVAYRPERPPSHGALDLTQVAPLH